MLLSRGQHKWDIQGLSLHFGSLSPLQKKWSNFVQVNIGNDKVTAKFVPHLRCVSLGLS